MSLVYLLIKQGTLQWIEAPALVTRKVTRKSIISLCEMLIYISHLEPKSSARLKSQLTPLIRESLMSPNVATAKLAQLDKLLHTKKVHCELLMQNLDRVEKSMLRKSRFLNRCLSKQILPALILILPS